MSGAAVVICALSDENDEEYVVLLPTEDDENEVTILRVEDDGDTESYVSIDDMETLDAIFQIFKEKFADEFDFDC